jgi:hypothetical protein
LIARAPFGASLRIMLNGETFPDIFAKGRKWFHRIQELFHFGVMGPVKRTKVAENDGFEVCDVTRLKYP